MNLYKNLCVVVSILLSSSVFGQLTLNEPRLATPPTASQPFSSNVLPTYQSSSYSSRNRDALLSGKAGVISASAVSGTSVYGSSRGSSTGAVLDVFSSSTGQLTSSIGSGLSGMSVSSASASFLSVITGHDDVIATAIAAPAMYGAAPPPPPGGGSTDKDKQLPLSDGIPMLLLCAAAYAVFNWYRRKKKDAASFNNSQAI